MSGWYIIFIPVQPIATSETAAKLTEYAVVELNICQATSHRATNIRVVNEIAYPKAILTRKGARDRKTLFNKTVPNATIIYVIDMSSATERPGNLDCQ